MKMKSDISGNLLEFTEPFRGAFTYAAFHLFVSNTGVFLLSVVLEAGENTATAIRFLDHNSLRLYDLG